jgi:hypothetical protein
MRTGKNFRLATFRTTAIVLTVVVLASAGKLVATRASSHQTLSSAVSASNSEAASAQNSGSVIVPAPPFISTPGIGIHNAQQNQDNLETAHDRQSGQDLKWDRAKKSWVDTKTGQAVGFDGQVARDGSLIPAPPFVVTAGVGLHQARQNRPTDGNRGEDIASAFDYQTGQELRWQPERQSWIDLRTGLLLGFHGALENSGAPGSTSAGNNRSAEIGGVGTCPTGESCAILKQIYDAADALTLMTGQALTEASAGKQGDLAQAAQLDQSASRRGIDPEIAKAQRQQAQGLRDKLPNAQANYDAAAKAALTAWANYRDCARRLVKDCPPKKSASASQRPDTNRNSQLALVTVADSPDEPWDAERIPPQSSTEFAPSSNAPVSAGTPAQPEMSRPARRLTGGIQNAGGNAAQQSNDSSLAADLCDRAKALRNIAKNDREKAAATQDQRARNFLLDDAKMMDGMAKEREDLARHYDPKACPEQPQTTPPNNNPGGNATAPQTSGGKTEAPSWGPWILIFPGLPLWNVDEQRWYGQNPDHSPRHEQPSQSGDQTGGTWGPWIMIFPGLPLWNVNEQRWYGFNPDHTAREDEQPDEPGIQCSPTGPTTASPGPGGSVGISHGISCNGDLSKSYNIPPKLTLRFDFSVKITAADLKYEPSDGSPPSVIPGALAKDGQHVQFDLPITRHHKSTGLDFKASYSFADVLPTTGVLREHLQTTPGISLDTPSWTAPILPGGQIGPFTETPRDPLNPGFRPYTGTIFPGTPGLISDPTTTSTIPKYNFDFSHDTWLKTGRTTLDYLPDSPKDRYVPTRYEFNPQIGSLRLDTPNYYRDSGTTGGSQPTIPAPQGVGTPIRQWDISTAIEHYWTPALRTSVNVYTTPTWMTGLQTPVTGYVPVLPQILPPSDTTDGQTSNALDTGIRRLRLRPLIQYVRPQAYVDYSSQYMDYFGWRLPSSRCENDFPFTLQKMMGMSVAQCRPSGSPRVVAAGFEAPTSPDHPRFQVVSLRAGQPSSPYATGDGQPRISGSQTRGQQSQQANPAQGFGYSIVSNGKSTGEAFQLQLSDPTGQVKSVQIPEGTVLEAIKPGVTQPVTASGGANLVKQPLNGYCLEFSKHPPAQGTMYRIADDATQEKYRPLRFLSDAGAQLKQKKAFHPDSDPAAYTDAILQYALWSKLEGWSQEQFTQHFVERTKENADALHVKWSSEMENALRTAAPGRWKDISEMIQVAGDLQKNSDQGRGGRRGGRGGGGGGGRGGRRGTGN